MNFNAPTIPIISTTRTTSAGFTSIGVSSGRVSRNSIATTHPAFQSAVDPQVHHPLKIGSKISFKAGPTVFRGRVDELEEHRTLRFSGKSQGSTATYLFRLESKGKRTQVFAAVNMGGLVVRATRPVMQAVAERAVLRWLDALEKAVPAATTKK